MRTAALALVVLLATAARAAAQPAPASQATSDDAARVAEAKRFFEAGRQAYEAGQYLVACTAFEEAYRLSPRPPVVFSMAQSYRRQYFVDRDPAKLKRAVDLYKEYLGAVTTGGRRDDAIGYVAELEPMLMRIEDDQRKKGMGPVKAMEMRPTDATQLMITSRTKGARGVLDGQPLAEVPMIKEVTPGKHVVRVEAPGYFPDEIEAVAVEGRFVVVEVSLRERPAALTVRGEDGAEVTVDGRPSGVLPLARPIELAAGKHLVVVSRRGRYPQSREVQVGRGQAMTITASLAPTTQRKATVWVFAAAGAALLGGGVTTGLALYHQGEAQAILDTRATEQIGQSDLDRYNRQRADRDGMVQASAVLYTGAVALAATATLLYLVDNPRVEAPMEAMPAPPPVVPAVSAAGGLGFVWSGTF